MLRRIQAIVQRSSARKYKGLCLGFYIFIIISSFMVSSFFYQKIFKTPYNRSGSPADIDGKILSDQFHDPFILPLLHNIFIFVITMIIYQKNNMEEFQGKEQMPWFEGLKLAISHTLIQILVIVAMILTSYIIVSVITSCQLIGAVIVAACFSKSSPQFKVHKRQIIIAVILCAVISLYMIFDENKKKDSVNKPIGWLSGLVFLAMLALHSYIPQQFAQLRDKYELPSLLLSRQLSKYCMIILFIISICSSYLQKTAIFIWQHDRIALDLFLDASFRAIGLLFSYKVSIQYKQHISPTINTVQKLLSSLFSAFYFHHNLNTVQFSCVGVVFTIILLDIYLNSENKKQQQLQKEKNQPTNLQTQIKQQI